MRVVNKEVFSDSRKSHFCGIEEHVRALVVLWPYPLPLEYSPKRLSNVQMWGIWWQEEEEESSFLPNGPEFFDPSVAVYRSIVKYDEGVPLYLEGKIIEEADNLFSGHALGGGETLVVVPSVNHPKYVESGNPLGRDEHVLSLQLPAIRDIPLSTLVALIAVIEVNQPHFGLVLKFLQLLDLVFVELRRGLSPWAFPYTLISCANADKKRLNVASLASFPVACSHASLALLTLCLSCSMAALTFSSSEQSMMGLRPRPGRVSRPFIPSASNRRTQPYTASLHISVCSPAFEAERPSDFRKTARQRIRKQWLAPCRKPSSNCRRSCSDSSNFFNFPISNRIYNYNTEIEKNIV